MTGLILLELLIADAYHRLQKGDLIVKNSFQIQPIGVVNKKIGNIFLEIWPDYNKALSGLETFSHIMVLYWLHENDVSDKRSVLQVYPRKNRANPLSGVFATHSPLRPNPIAVTICQLMNIENNSIQVKNIDAFDQSPIIDIKCYLPEKLDRSSIQLPKWAKTKTK